MKPKLHTIFGFAGLMLMLSVPLFAHHGTAAYDLTKTITTKATVTQWEFANPHSILHFDVKDESGNVRSWSVEMYNVLSMTRAGWTKNTLKPGDEITISFHPAKSGVATGYVRENDGEIVFNGKKLSLIANQ